ncbi:MAG: FAD-binding oxidoreductase [Alphaproteobacteria bacterium]|nr:FAD-binding oxidoreductase [Alphaproteobacteria bacterium]MBV8411184.1 FAD-binding oxidoreductase [Alphaproteobacteria bacterium]
MHLPLHDDPRPPQTTYTAGGGKPLGLGSLSGAHRCDVAIVGGGIAGCSAALHAAEAGARVVLLEAHQIGWGASGRNAGHVPPATKHDPDQVIARYGAEAGQRLIDAAEQGPPLLAELIERHRIDCDYSVPGIIMAAHTEAAMRANEKRVAYWQARGRPVELLDRRQAAEMIGSEYYLGGWIDRRGGKINPLAYVRGLARAAIEAGASLHEATRATRLARNGGKWRLTTSQGEVEADRVFLCTNAYTDDLWPGLRATIVPVRAYQFASRPLRDNVRKSILPGGQPMTDSRRLLSGIRIHGDGRLQFGGQGPAFGPQGAPHWRATRARLERIFPQLGNLETDFWWTGFMAMNADNSWHIHELAPGLLAMLGCNGRGVALATLWGRELARHAAGAPARDFVLPPSQPRRLWLHPVARPLVSALIQYYALRDAIEIRRLERQVRPVP